MKTLYFDLGMGAAGDMLAAALLEVTEAPSAALEALAAAGIPDVTFRAQKTKKCGVTGTKLHVLAGGAEEAPLPDAPAHDHIHDHEHTHDREHTHDHDHIHDHAHEHTHDHDHPHGHAHTGLADVRRLIDGLRLPAQVRADALAVYERIAEAESRVHGESVELVHFHEVGALDAVADVTAVCYLLWLLAPDRIAASPVHVGSGTVRCAHGILPVPAPAAALLLEGIPTYGGEIKGELCTPTGAALLRHFVQDFGPQPVMAAQKIGYGMGTKDFPQANCVRALLGESADQPTDRVVELRCNVDDMSAERLGFAMERIYEAGAREVFFVPATMKKSRPGVLLTAICDPERREAVARAVFRHTSTIGLREIPLDRCVLARETLTEETPFGPVRKKVSRGYGVTREKYEYEDLARIAQTEGMTIEEVLRALGEAGG